ncbi:hypothetical protein BD309DRAFT_949838 [Dichomitus squalens]|nr:hypothetical protein BD309DRAFT_949838 [Dichomitus squalens]
MYPSLQPSRGNPGEGMATDVIGGPGSCSRSQEYTCWRVGTVSHSLGISGPSRGLELDGARPRLELWCSTGCDIRGRSAARRRAGSWTRLRSDSGSASGPAPIRRQPRCSRALIRRQRRVLGAAMTYERELHSRARCTGQSNNPLPSSHT